jgi:hypothetical protein
MMRQFSASVLLALACALLPLDGDFAKADSVVTFGGLTAASLCNVTVTPPKDQKIVAIKGASHQRSAVARFVIEYNDATGHPQGAFEPDFSPPFKKVRWRASSSGLADRDDYLAFAGTAPVKLDDVNSISIIPLFLRDGAPFCMRQIATIPHDATVRSSNDELASSVRLLFFVDYGAPVNSTLVIEFGKK